MKIVKDACIECCEFVIHDIDIKINETDIRIDDTDIKTDETDIKIPDTTAEHQNKNLGKLSDPLALCSSKFCAIRFLKHKKLDSNLKSPVVWL